MNAYQIPTFNAGPTTASPFNYFPQNSHSYAGVISSSYGTGSPVRTVSASSNLNPHHHHAHSHKTTTMTSSQSAVAAAAAVSSFVSPSNYFHQSHHHAHHPHTTHHPHHPLQPFSTTFTPNTTVQTSSGTTNPYAHNHYSAYSNGSSSSNSNTNNSSNMANNANNDGVNNNSNSGQTNFDYGQNYNSITNNSTVTSGNAAIVAATAAAYPYGLTNCSTNNYSSPYSPNSIINNSPNNGNNSSNSTYQSTNNNESYLSLCNNNNRGILDNNEDIYTLNIPKNETTNNSNGNNDGTNEGTSLPPIKKVKRNGRGRTRKQINNPSPSSPENNIDRIFIWYIDETILSYLTISEYNRFAGFNDTLTTSLYNEIFMFINKFAEKYLFLSDLKDIDQSHIDDSAADDNGQDLSNYNFNADGFKTSVSCNMGSTLNSADLRQKMALRYRKISETYSNYCDKLDDLFLDKADYEQLQDLLKRFDSFSKNWIHPAIKALSFIKTRPNCLNVLISSSPLIYTLAKLMVFNLGPYFSIGNVYSCSKTSKEHTLNRVLSRFGSSCTYIVIGKGSDEQQLSQKLELPFWPVTEREHFESLLNAMHYFF